MGNGTAAGRPEAVSRWTGTLDPAAFGGLLPAGPAVMRGRTTGGAAGDESRRGASDMRSPGGRWPPPGIAPLAITPLATAAPVTAPPGIPVFGTHARGAVTRGAGDGGAPAPDHPTASPRPGETVPP